MPRRTLEESVVESAIALLNNKRQRTGSEETGNKGRRAAPAGPALPPAEKPDKSNQVDAPPATTALKPYPFFFYNDYSTEKDPDPLIPLTPPGRVPNFPAKMHSILSRPDLTDIICWKPHGRAWRVLKPREFEIRVIPTYFEHSKFSSFIRQANGWGFRRITQGRDRNSYYHERFLRGLPHLSKKMKRPGVAKKLAADPDHEPDLYKISELYPIKKEATDDSILLPSTLKDGPKARMPIYASLKDAKSTAEERVYSTKDLNMPKIGSLTVAATPKLASLQASTLDSFKQSLALQDAKQDRTEHRNEVGTPQRKHETHSACASANSTGGAPGEKRMASTPAAPQRTSNLPYSFGGSNVSSSDDHRMIDVPQYHQPVFGTQNLSGNVAVDRFVDHYAQPFSGPTNWSTPAAPAPFAVGFATAAALNQQAINDLVLDASWKMKFGSG